MKYIAKKAAAMLVTLFVISLLAFLAFEVIPGDPTTKMLGTDWTPERAAALRAELGLTAPLPLRYLPAPPGYTLCLCTGEPGEVNIEDL